MKEIFVMLFISIVGGITTLVGYKILQRAWRRNHLQDYEPAEEDSGAPHVGTQKKDNRPNATVHPLPVRASSLGVANVNADDKPAVVLDMQAFQQRRRNQSQLFAARNV